MQSERVNNNMDTNNDFVDESWYIKPPGVREDVSAGGVVMRMEAAAAW